MEYVILRMVLRSCILHDVSNAVMNGRRTPMTTEAHRFRIGAFDCLAISDGGFNYPCQAFAVNVSQEVVQRELAAEGRSSDHIFTPYTCLAIDTGRNKMLVDTGAGSLTSPSRAWDM
jgi:hypothetical protein